MKICQSDASLLTADVVLQVLFKSLAKNSSDLSEKMTQALRKYYEIRKLPKIVSPLKYLKQLYKDESDPLFANASRSNLIKMANSLMKRLFEVHHEDFEEEGLESDDFEENVNMALKKVSKSATREDKEKTIL